MKSMCEHNNETEEVRSEDLYFRGSRANAYNFYAMPI